MGLVGGTNAFLNVWFATLNPGSPTNPWAGISSQLVILDNTGVDLVLDTAKWQVKAYLLHSPTWA
jgi:predicted phosphodiesterase